MLYADGIWQMHQGAGWWMLFGWLWFLIFLGGTIALVVWIIHRLTAPGPDDKSKSDPLQIAKERYARGEISKEEYERLKKDLS